MAISAGLLFVVNLLLTLMDASVGYHLAPVLVRMRLDEEGEPMVQPRTLRSFLGVVVALFTFVNCSGYYRGSMILLQVLAVAILLDMAIMLLLWRRIAGR
jgi:hypothetical protein